MIELIAAAVTGAVVGGGVIMWHWGRDALAGETLNAEQRAYITTIDATASWALRTLSTLRSNCFIPDERGVKVRYSQASVERRVKAETPKGVA